MKLTKYTLILSCLLGLTESLAWAQSAPQPFQLAANTVQHRLSSAQIAKLRSSGVPVIVPGYLPSGFYVSRIDVKKDMAPGLMYEIVYRRANGEEFWLEGNAAGFGGEMADMTMDIPNPVLGTLNLERHGPNDQRNSSYVATFSYRGKGYYFGSDSHRGLRIAGPDVINILKGLRVI